MVSLADRCRQTSTSKAPPFALQPPTAEWFALSTLPATTDIPLVLVGRTSAGVVVGVAVGRGHLDNNGAVVVDTVESGAVDFATADVVEIFASATMSALLEMIATSTAALAATLGTSATRNVGTGADTVAAGDDARLNADALVWLDTGARGVPGWIYQGSAGGAHAIGAGSSRMTPFFAHDDITLTAALFTVAVAGDVVDIAVWELDPQRASPGFVVGERIAQVTGVPVAATGAVEVALSVNLQRGKWYAVSLTAQATMSVNGYVLFAPGARTGRAGQVPSAAGSNVVQAYSSTTGYPAPTPWTAPVTMIVSNGAAGFRSPFLLGWS